MCDVTYIFSPKDLRVFQDFNFDSCRGVVEGVLGEQGLLDLGLQYLGELVEGGAVPVGQFFVEVQVLHDELRLDHSGHFEERRVGGRRWSCW